MRAAFGLEPGTFESGFQCSTTELYNFWYRTYNQLALLFDRYIKWNRYYNFFFFKLKKLKAATGLEPGTFGSGFQCSTTELYNFWYRTYNQLALLFDRYIKLNRYYNLKKKKIESSNWNWTRHLWVGVPTLYHWAI